MRLMHLEDGLRRHLDLKLAISLGLELRLHTRGLHHHRFTSLVAVICDGLADPFDVAFLWPLESLYNCTICYVELTQALKRRAHHLRGGC
eukprot:jgi/Chrpa1/25053/Chrysochromulina_OHIO_Genome00000232-RA